MTNYVEQLTKLNPICFLYPSDPMNKRQVDIGYYEEYLAAKNAGLSVHIFDVEDILDSFIYPVILDTRFVVYRGWMLNELSYTHLEKRFGNQLITSKKDYFNAHYLPNWYVDLESLTIRSIVTDEANVQEQYKVFSGKVFIKDYVKSLKTGCGSIATTFDDVNRTIAAMKDYRGTIEGGLVLREVVDLIPESEIRFFVVNNVIFGPSQNCSSYYSLVNKVIKKLEGKRLKFYSIDIATTTNGSNILIEIGDGQVSDYVGWSVEKFINVLEYLKYS